MQDLAAGFDPTRYSDVPLYNIQAVTSATGVPSITLRSWERRYGVPRPQRDSKGYRLYSQRDIAIVQWLHYRIQEGVGISRAVNMLSVLENRNGTGEAATRLDVESLLDELVTALTRTDEARVGRVLAQALTVTSVEDAALHLVQPALYRIGDMWAERRIGVTVEHFASNVLRSHLGQLTRISPLPLRRQTVLAGSVPGELHDIGALMLTLFLRRRGFGVIFVGASLEADDFVSYARESRAAAVCLSAATIQSVGALAALCTRLQETYTGVIGYGGQALNANPDLAAGIPGEWLGFNASEATARLESLVLAGSESGELSASDA